MSKEIDSVVRAASSFAQLEARMDDKIAALREELAPDFEETSLLWASELREELLTKRVGVLEAAIREHRNTVCGFRPTSFQPADNVLWRVLNGR